MLAFSFACLDEQREARGSGRQLAGIPTAAAAVPPPSKTDDEVHGHGQLRPALSEHNLLPAGGYGGLGYATKGFGKGYRRDATSPVEAVRALVGRIGLRASDFRLGMIPPNVSRRARILEVWQLL